MGIKRRPKETLIAAMVLFVIVCSFFFPVAEVDHDCEGEGCRICCLVAVCQSILKSFLAAMFCTMLGSSSMATLPGGDEACRRSISKGSLVALKVKLSD